MDGPMARSAAVAASAAAVVVATVVLAAFAATRLDNRPGGDPPEPAEPPEWTIATACPGWSADPLRSVPVVRLPPDLGPVTDAFICSTTRKIVPDDGEWLFQEARRITGGLEELLHVYAMPDARPTPTDDTSTVEQICLFSISITPPIWLHGAAVLAVRPPLGRCGNPIRGVNAALRRLTTQVVVSEPVRQVSSQLSIDSGCSDQGKNVMSIDAELGEPPSSESPQPLPIEPHLVCTYQVIESGDDWRLIAADRIGPAQLEPINSALAESVPEASCRRGIESRYAVMYPAERDGEFATYVAVDGCAVQQDNRWWRASDQLRALLTVG